MNYSKYGKILSFRYEAIIVAMSLLIVCAKSSLCDENVRLNFIDDIPIMDSMKIEPELSFGFASNNLLEYLPTLLIVLATSDVLICSTSTVIKKSITFGTISELGLSKKR